MNEVILLIPIYQPDEKTVTFIKELRQMITAPIVIVDDGSGANYRTYFLQMQAPDVRILSYAENRGKGYALKLGLKFIKDKYPENLGVVTADGDGQHTIPDIEQMLSAVQQAGDATIVLGTRQFNLQSTPLRSLFGNRMTSFFYYLSSGIWLTDTQTGLRGFPRASIADLLEISGNRFEYEMNQLIELPSMSYSFEKVPITTVYEKKNHQSHFRTIQDSYLVYKPLVTFLFSSMSSAGIDVLVFLFMVLLFGHSATSLLIATVSSRLLSGVYNYHVNRKVVFHSQASMRQSFWKYGLLFVTQMILSWLGVTALNSLIASVMICKIIVDSLLFLGSFTIQKRVVFRLT